MRTSGAKRLETTEGVVILGVDTHLDFHVAVAIDHLGRSLGEASVPTTPKGYERLLRWAEGFGSLRCAGVEGTSSYGVGLTRHLRAKGIEVLKVERPKHRRPSSRRNLQKSDPSDAEAAARAVLAGEASGVPKSADGKVEMIRALRAARRSAIKARTQAANQLQALCVTAPEQLRNRLRGLPTKELVCVAARFRLADDPSDVPTATKVALRSVARRGTVEKTEAPAPSVTDVVTDDEGHTDLFDFQYLLFNLVLLLWFAVEMFRTLSDPNRLADEAYFLPPLPLSLVGLTSASAAGYVVKKGLETESPTLQAVYPSVAAPHDEVLLTGRNLRITTAAPAAGAGPERVTFGGRTAEVVQPLRANPQGFDEINARVPTDAQPGRADAQFTRADGAVSETLGFEVVLGGPKVPSVSPDCIVLREETDPAGRQRITILGSGFGGYDTQNDPPSNRVSLGGVLLETSVDNWTTERIWALAPTLADAKNAGLDVPGRTELVVIDRYGRRSVPTAVDLVEVAN